MNVLLVEKSEYLSDIARKCNVEASKIISANSHLSNFQMVDSGELLIIPHSEITEFSPFYQLEKSEFYSLVNHNRFIKRKRQTEVITWTIAVSGGEAVITLAGTAAVAGISIIVGVAAVAGLAYLTSGEKNFRMNSATNVGVPAASTPNASVNVNSNTNSNKTSTVVLSEMAKAKRRIESEFAITFVHLNYLQNGKGPDCLPGSQCYEDNKNHWKKEIKTFLNNAEKYLKNVRGKTKEAIKETIEQLRAEADKF